MISLSVKNHQNGHHFRQFCLWTQSKAVSSISRAVAIFHRPLLTVSWTLRRVLLINVLLFSPYFPSEPNVRTHLKAVYGTMSLGLIAASVGAYIHLYTMLLSGGLISFLGVLGFTMALYSTPDTVKNRSSRLGYFLGLALCTGLSMGPLLDLVLFINPAIITTALFSTSFIFACFSLSTFFADHRQSLYLGGTLMSFLSLLSLMSLVNIFLGSKILMDVSLYIGLFLFCGFICYDTALIIEKRRMGDDDYISHAVLLFIDFIAVFKRLVIILTQREQESDRRKRR